MQFKQPIEEFGGTDLVMNLAVANGFPPATYRPLMQPFTEYYRVTCLLPRALWGNPPPDQPRSWRETLARDLLDGIHAHNFRDIIAVGHSFGGIASLLATIEDPTRFKALILLDPTILDLTLLEGMDMLHATHQLDQLPLATRAMRRQRSFASADEAFTYFRSRSLFADWSDEAVHLYAEYGTRPTENGVTLVWSPEWEAYYFKTIYTKIWDDLPKLRGLLPILLIRGETSDTLIPESAAKIREMLPDITYAEIKGHGHLFPQSNPDATRAVMQAWLKTL